MARRKRQNYRSIGYSNNDLAFTKRCKFPLPGKIINAFANAHDNAKERVQGRLLTNPKAGRVPIINHEDIKRTLMMGKAHIEAMQAMMYRVYLAFDERHRDPDLK